MNINTCTHCEKSGYKLSGSCGNEKCKAIFHNECLEQYCYDNVEICKTCQNKIEINEKYVLNKFQFLKNFFSGIFMFIFTFALPYALFIYDNDTIYKCKNIFLSQYMDIIYRAQSVTGSSINASTYIILFWFTYSNIMVIFGIFNLLTSTRLKIKYPGGFSFIYSSICQLWLFLILRNEFNVPNYDYIFSFPNLVLFNITFELYSAYINNFVKILTFGVIKID